jgi:hypothetical protein
VDRLSHLTGADWGRLKHELKSREVRVVALDVPTFYASLQASDTYTMRIFNAINGMMLDMLTAIA